MQHELIPHQPSLHLMAMALWLYVLFTINANVPLNQFLHFLAHSINSSPHFLLAFIDCCHYFLQLLKGGSGILATKPVVWLLVTCRMHSHLVAAPSCPRRSEERRAINTLFTTKVVIPQHPWGLSMHMLLLLRTLVWTHPAPVIIAHKC